LFAPDWAILHQGRGGWWTAGTNFERSCRGRGLSKRYGAANVSTGSTSRSKMGALVTLLGPSGCGKTTLLRLIAGLVTPDERFRSIAGWMSTRTPPPSATSAWCAKTMPLFPHLTVCGNVGFGLQSAASPRYSRGQVERALELVQMGHYADRPVRGLSAQAAARRLARAACSRPSVLLFDRLERARPQPAARRCRSSCAVCSNESARRHLRHAMIRTSSDDVRPVAVMNAGRMSISRIHSPSMRGPRPYFTMRFRRKRLPNSGHSSARRCALAGRHGRKATFLRRELIPLAARSSSRRGGAYRKINTNVGPGRQPESRPYSSDHVSGFANAGRRRCRIGSRFIVELGGVNELRRRAKR